MMICDDCNRSTSMHCWRHPYQASFPTQPAPGTLMRDALLAVFAAEQWGQVPKGTTRTLTDVIEAGPQRDGLSVSSTRSTPWSGRREAQPQQVGLPRMVAEDDYNAAVKEAYEQGYARAIAAAEDTAVEEAPAFAAPAPELDEVEPETYDDPTDFDVDRAAAPALDVEGVRAAFSAAGIHLEGGIWLQIAAEYERQRTG